MQAIKTNAGQSVAKQYFSILVPTIFGNLATSIYVFFDVIFIGTGAGSNGLAALNISMPIFSLLIAMSMMFGVGGATIMSVNIGMGKQANAKNIFCCAIALDIIVAVIFTFFGTVFVEPIVRLLGASDIIINETIQYFGTIAAGSVGFLLSHTMGVFIRCDGNPRLVMAANIISGVLNIVLDYIFVFPMKMGIFGAALATAICPLVSTAVLMLHFLRKDRIIGFALPQKLVPNVLRIIRNGTGTFVLEMSGGIVILIFNYFLMKISGETSVSAYAVISNIAFIMVCVLSGVALSAQPIISRNYGAGDTPKIKKAATLSFVTAGAFAVIFFVLVLMFSRQIVSWFTKDDIALIDIGSRGMKLYFTSALPTGMSIILMYYLQSTEKSKEAMAISLMRGLLFILAGVTVLTPAMGIDGVWLTVTFAEVLTLAVAGITYLIKQACSRGRKQP